MYNFEKQASGSITYDFDIEFTCTNNCLAIGFGFLACKG
jgi:hypothetical protein